MTQVVTELFLIRHGRAADRDAFAATGAPDTDRPLTRDGARRLRAAARGLRVLFPHLDGLASSPLRRTRESAAIVGKAYRLVAQVLQELAPGGDPAALTRWIAGQRTRRLALVGHEPDLGRLGAYLLTGTAADFLPLKKGAVCCLSFDGAAGAGLARLRFLLDASQLRRFAG